jgi:hemoglobin
MTSTAATSATGHTDENSLFERLGGEPAVKAAMHRFFERVFADPELAPVFERVNKPHHVSSVTRFVAAATGGPEPWSGRDMAAAHRRIRISQRQFDRVAAHLAAALDELAVPTDTAGEVMTLVGSLGPQIVH